MAQEPTHVIVDAETLRTIVREAVSDALIRVGLDTSNAEATRRDLAYLRQWRETMETIKTQGLVAGVKWIMTGFFALIAIGIGVKFGLPGK